MSGMYAGMQLNSDNLLKTASILSPIIVVLFMSITSLFNQNLKGLIYLAGLLITLTINLFLMNQLQVKDDVLPGEVCNLIDIPLFGTEYNSPLASSVILIFTLFYLGIPMVINSNVNYFVIAFFMVLYGIDGFYKTSVKCARTSSCIIGGLVGAFFASIYVMLLHSNGYDSLLYFNDFQSNNVTCSKPSKQTFKCSVYKNGQLISSNIA
jgi:hypothetical protein